jgi:hypothetical protein
MSQAADEEVLIAGMRTHLRLYVLVCGILATCKNWKLSLEATYFYHGGGLTDRFCERLGGSSVTL